MRKNKLFKFLLFNQYQHEQNINQVNNSIKQPNTKRRSILRKTDKDLLPEKSFSILSDSTRTTRTAKSKTKTSNNAQVWKSLFISSSVKIKDSSFNTTKKGSFQENSKVLLEDCIDKAYMLKTNMISSIQDKIKQVEDLEKCIVILKKRLKLKRKNSSNYIKYEIISAKRQWSSERPTSEKIDFSNELQEMQMRLDAFQNEKRTLFEEEAQIRNQSKQIEEMIKTRKRDIFNLTNENRGLKKEIQNVRKHIEILKTKIKSNTESTEKTYMKVQDHIAKDEQKYQLIHQNSSNTLRKPERKSKSQGIARERLKYK